MTHALPALEPIRRLTNAHRCCDALIDLHSGGMALDHLPLIGNYRHHGKAAEKLARSFDPALHPWVLPDVPGVLSYEAHRLGRIALGAEWRGGAGLDPVGVSAYRMGLRRLLVSLGMLPPDMGTPMPPDVRPAIEGDYQETSQGGLFLSKVVLGARVERGATLGHLMDALGKHSTAVCAERAGTVAGLPHLPLLLPGDRMAYIG